MDSFSSPSTMLSVIDRIDPSQITDCSSFDFHLVKHLQKLEGKLEKPYLQWAVLLLSHKTSLGNVCIQISSFSNTFLSLHLSATVEVKFPPYKEWVEQLKQCKIIGRPGEQKPLVLDITPSGANLYFYRYWNYENELISTIRKRINAKKTNESNQHKSFFKKLFTSQEDPNSEIEFLAIQNALQKKLTLITGGPGTGKTTTVIKLLAYLIETSTKENFSYKLAAPTGKAASRLSESIQKGKEHLLKNGLISEKIYEQISSDSTTIHRLLGTQMYKSNFVHNKNNPLCLDCLIIDEVSMVDLALMSKLMIAIPESTQLILIGDKNQLTSVESGAVLNDLCNNPESLPTALQECIVTLKRVYRTEGKDILNLTRYINDQNITQVKKLLFTNEVQEEKEWEEIFSFSQKRSLRWRFCPPSNSIKDWLLPLIQGHFKKIQDAKSIGEAFKIYKSFSILCAMKIGIYGTEAINKMIEDHLTKPADFQDRNCYKGRPIIIVHNNYQLNLYNGDIGIAFDDKESPGKLNVYFEIENGYRKISPARLPEHLTSYAITIHKSQGSEFEKVLLILPKNENKVLSKELIYTGVTRAKKSVFIWSDWKTIELGLKRNVNRTSGLKEKLQNIESE